MADMIISDEQRRARLAHRHRLSPERRSDDVLLITDSLLALHATDPPTVHLSTWARMRTPRPDAVTEHLGTGELLRHHAMRRTIWVARTPTMARMHEAAGRKVAATERRTMITALANAGVDDPEQWIDRARIEVLALLRAEGPLNSRTIGSRLPRLNLTLRLAPGTKWEARQSAHTRLMTLLGFEGVLARTTPIGGWHTSEFAWLPTEDVIGTALTGPPLAESAAELAAAWLRQFGPATTDDLQWWMGWTKTLTRQALADAGALPVRLNEGPGWLAADDLGEVAVEPWVALLPTLDPTTMGWKHRGWYLSERAATDAFDRAGNAAPTIWVDGRVVGTWAQREDREIRLHWFDDVPTSRRAQVEARAEEVAAWVGDTRYRVRFPSRLHRDLVG
ncbi:winged helix DNA-binding domain-containing protein [Naumannella halotolerans]|uniref:winged helix DNA-binding domain-containing protein n=1 Tax=Naumannella halotolerans TaxID=993414 RepID=UPI00370D5131